MARTTDLDPAPTLVEVLGHADVAGALVTARVPVDDLAAQMAASGPIADRIEQAGSTLLFTLLSEVQGETAKLGYPEHSKAELRQTPPAPATDGIWKKVGPVDGGSWERTGPLAGVNKVAGKSGDVTLEPPDIAGLSGLFDAKADQAALDALPVQVIPGPNNKLAWLADSASGKAVVREEDANSVTDSRRTQIKGIVFDSIEHPRLAGVAFARVQGIGVIETTDYEGRVTLAGQVSGGVADTEFSAEHVASEDARAGTESAALWNEAVSLNAFISDIIWGNAEGQSIIEAREGIPPHPQTREPAFGATMLGDADSPQAPGSTTFTTHGAAVLKPFVSTITRPYGVLTTEPPWDFEAYAAAYVHTDNSKRVARSTPPMWSLVYHLKTRLLAANGGTWNHNFHGSSIAQGGSLVQTLNNRKAIMTSLRDQLEAAIPVDKTMQVGFCAYQQGEEDTSNAGSTELVNNWLVRTFAHQDDLRLLSAPATMPDNPNWSRNKIPFYMGALGHSYVKKQMRLPDGTTWVDLDMSMPNQIANLARYKRPASVDNTFVWGVACGAMPTKSNPPGALNGGHLTANGDVWMGLMIAEAIYRTVVEGKRHIALVPVDMKAYRKGRMVICPMLVRPGKKLAWKHAFRACTPTNMDNKGIVPIIEASEAALAVQPGSFFLRDNLFGFYLADTPPAGDLALEIAGPQTNGLTNLVATNGTTFPHFTYQYLNPATDLTSTMQPEEDIPALNGELFSTDDYALPCRIPIEEVA